MVDEQLLVFERYGAGKANFIHVEEFLPGKDLKPPPATAQHLSPAFKAWGFQDEPWVIVIDAEGHHPGSPGTRRHRRSADRRGAEAPPVKRWSTRRRALVLAAVLTCASCSSSGSVSEPSDSTPALNATTVALLPTTTPGLPTFDKEQFQQLLGQLRGTPVVVNIWASWCGPCRDEAPILAQAARTYGQRVQFLGVDILDTTGAATAFVREFHIPYPSVFDPSGHIRDALGFFGQPDTIFYGPDGSRVTTLSGSLSQHDCDNKRCSGPEPRRYVDQQEFDRLLALGVASPSWGRLGEHRHGSNGDHAAAASCGACARFAGSGG